jgi:hypothetical protein
MCLGVVAASIAVGEWIKAVGQPGFALVAGLAGAAVVGFLAAMVARLIQLPSGLAGLISLMELGKATVSVVFNVESGALKFWHPLVGFLFILPGVFGAYVYCRLNDNWDPFAQMAQSQNASEKGAE